MLASKTSIGLAILIAAASTASAQVDSVQILLTQAQAAGSNPPTAPGLINAVGYDPITDTAYTSVSAPNDLTIRIRRITNVSTSPTASTVLTPTQLDTWLQRGENRTGTGFPGGLTFNPAPVGSIPTAGNLWIADTPGISLVGSSTNDPAASLRVYRYNLQDVPTTFPTIFENVNQVLTPLISKADKQIAAVGTASTANDSGNRPAVFSPDANWLYLLDSGGPTGIPGIYRAHPLNAGSIVKLPTPSTVSVASEPAVIKNGSLDRIYYRSSNNTNGLSYVEHDPVANTTSAETVAFSSAQLQDFLETTTAPVVAATTSDGNGNVYFWVTLGPTSTGTGVLLKTDAAGRLVKVTNRAERAHVLGVPASGTGAAGAANTRLSTYVFTHPTAGAITRIVGNEVIYGITVTNVFKPYDFDRDGDEDANDINAFKGKLTLRGIPSPIADARYDMNGNGSIDWKDVKVLQTFAGFPDGDADMNGIANIGDFAVLAGNFNLTGMRWTEGDFTGNEVVEIGDFSMLAANFNVPTLSRSVAAGAVPEPSACLMGGALVAVAGARRRNRR